MKSKKSAAKRFSATGTGKIKRGHAFTSHILTTKSQKQKRNLRKNTLVCDANIKSVRKMLPYL